MYLPAPDAVRPKKRLRTDAAAPKDKFNLSNDQFYEVSKEGGRHRVRQTFGQLVVEHAYPAQKLQLPFVSICRLSFIFKLMYIVSLSTRHDCRNKKLGLSIGLLCSSLPISSFTLAKYVLRRRRKIKRVVRLERAEMWVRVCTAQMT